MRQRIRWLAMHGVVRASASMLARRGDPQGRLIADPSVRADPVAFTEELRAQGPIVKCRLVYITVDHKIANDLLRSDDFRVIAIGSNLPRPLRWVARRTSTGSLHPLEQPSMLSVEPPEHTRYRKLVSSVFTTRAVAALRDRVEDTANTLLDDLGDQAGIVDIVARYCSQLPVTVIGDILGVPDAAPHPGIRRSGCTQPGYRPDLGAVSAGLSRYRRLQRLARGSPQTTAEQPGRRSDEPTDSGEQERRGRRCPSERSRTAGHRRVGVGCRLRNHGQPVGQRNSLAARRAPSPKTLAARPELWPNAVEEILRLESPVQLSARMASKDTDIAGTLVRRGEVIIIYLAGANRDPKVFDDPHRFDLDRENAGKHLSFSGGRHFCVGAALARAEGEVGLRTFFDRYPDARLAATGSRRDTRVLRGWSSLPITLDKARTAVGS